MLVAKSITLTLFDWLMYARVPSGVRAIFRGKVPTGTVAITVSVARSITDTLFEPWFATYALDPSGFIAMSKGVLPTGILAIAVLVARSTSKTKPVPEQAPPAQGKFRT